jgi:hypothetical protein
MDARSETISKLRSFCDSGFGGSTSEAALVLGREATEIEEMLKGNAPIDEDLEMKMNGIAEERDIPLGRNSEE